MSRLISMMGCLWVTLALSAGPAAAEKRVALVIGNASYQNAPSLANPVNDARAMADLFRDAGFDVVEARADLGNLAFKRVAREFTAVARDADIAVMYFAGHGIEVNGTNYLLPVDARLATDFDVEDEALSLDRMVRALEPARRLRLIILDACRDNPFVRTMQRGVTTRQVASGLAKVEPAASDTLIAFAAKAGSTAQDGQGDNSPFTAALVKNLAVPGRDIRIAFGHVRDEVVRATANRQEPFVYGSLGGATVALVPERNLTPPPAAAQPAPGPDPRRDYEFAERVGTEEAWAAFLSVHGSGFYAELARAQRDKAARAQAPEVPQVPPVPKVTPPPEAKSVVAAAPPIPELTKREIGLRPAPQGDLRIVTRNLQTELRRVGCDPGPADGVWSPKSRDAMSLFNRHSGLSLDTGAATVGALEVVKGQRSRICPLVCATGQHEQGGRCVAIPATVKPHLKKEAVRPSEPARRERTRERARERIDRARERARGSDRDDNVSRRPVSRAVCPGGATPMPQGGRMCCETTPDRGAPRIFCL